MSVEHWDVLGDMYLHSIDGLLLDHLDRVY